MRRLNQFGTWAGDVFKNAKEGVHDAAPADVADVKQMIRHTEKLTAKILELR
jgi:hypothetical protein